MLQPARYDSFMDDLPDQIAVSHTCSPATSQSRPLRSFLMVGARVGNNVLDMLDEQYFLAFGKRCLELGYEIDAEPEISVCNLEYGDDFLTTPITAMDAVLFCFLYHPPTYNGPALTRLCAHSPRAHDQGIWAHALNNTGASIVGNITGIQELPTPRLLEEGFFTQIHGAGLFNRTDFIRLDILARRPI